MKLKNSIKMITLSVVASTLFVGCGGSSDTTEEENKEISIENILDKTFNHIKCTKLLGCSSDSTFIFTDTAFIGTLDGIESTMTYTREPESDIIHLEGEWANYFKVLTISDTVVKLCAGNETREEAQACTEANEYWVVPDYTTQFITTQNASMGTVLAQKTLITNFDDIQNKFLYQINGWRSGITKNAIKIDLDGKLSRYYTSEINSSLELEIDNADIYYNASFENNFLNITGKEQGEDIDSKYSVSKYNLSGESILVKDFASEDIFDKSNLVDRYSDGKTFSFTKGNMYCSLLWHECWVDEDAINQMIEQSLPSYVAVDKKFTQAFLDITVFYKTSDQYPQYKNKYIDGQIYFAGDEGTLGWDSSFDTSSSTYTLENGILHSTFSDGRDLTYEITEVTDDYIVVLGKVGTDSGTEKWYTNKEKAKSELGN